MPSKGSLRGQNKFEDVMEPSSDSELEGSTCDEELQSQEDIDANISEDGLLILFHTFYFSLNF